MRDFRKLNMWQKSHSLTVAIYRVTSQFPKEELYGLSSQIRRSSASIPANIAEGCGRDSEADFARFLHIACGSASELEYHLILSHDIGLLKSDDYDNIVSEVNEIKKMLITFTKKLKAKR